MEGERRSSRRKPLSDRTNIITDSPLATSLSSSATPLVKSTKPYFSTAKKPEKKNNTKSATTGKVTSLSSSTSLAKPTKPCFSTSKRSEKNNNSTNFTTPATKIHKNLQNPRSGSPLPASPLQFPDSSSTGTRASLTVYSRRQTTSKRKKHEKVVAVPLTSLPPERFKNIGIKLNEADDVGTSKTCTVPCKKIFTELFWRKRHCLRPDEGVSRNGMVQDSVEEEGEEEDVSKTPLPKEFVEKQRAYFAEIDEFELPVEVVSDTESDSKSE